MKSFNPWDKALKNVSAIYSEKQIQKAVEIVSLLSIELAKEGFIGDARVCQDVKHKLKEINLL